MNDVVGMAKQLFAQPMGEKLKIDITQSAHHRGYGAIATEQLDPSLPGDCKETFDMGRHLLADDPDVLAEKPLHGPNRYPDIDGFQATMETHYWRMLELGKTILKGIAVALGIAPDYFDSRFTHPISVLRFIHYPLLLLCRRTIKLVLERIQITAVLRFCTKMKWEVCRSRTVKETGLMQRPYLIPL